MPREPSLPTILDDTAALMRRKFARLLWKLRSASAATVTFPTNIGRFTVPAHDHAIGWRLFHTRDYEPELVSAVSAVLPSLPDWAPSQGTLLDIGASIGVISIRLLSLGLFNTAIAVEPEPQSFSLLIRNVAQNALQHRVVCLNCALSDRPGAITLHTDPRDRGLTHVVPHPRETRPGTAPARTISVQATTLDQMLNDLPTSMVRLINLVWIDVEGYEARVFAGALHALSRPIPTVAEFFPQAMRRVGVTPGEYSDIAQRIWSSFWVLRADKFVRYPVALLHTLFEEFAYDSNRSHTNILLT
jgi:FkbM family methyltransferase